MLKQFKYLTCLLCIFIFVSTTLSELTHVKSPQHGLYSRFEMPYHNGHLKSTGNVRGMANILNTNLVYIGKCPFYANERSGWIYLLDLTRNDSNSVVSVFCGGFDYDTDMVIGCWSLESIFKANSYPVDITYDEATGHLFVLTFVKEPTQNINLNYDDVIDLKDLIYFSRAWLKLGLDEKTGFWRKEDFNYDLKVNLKDFQYLQKNMYKEVGYANEDQYWNRPKFSYFMLEIDPVTMTLLNKWDITHHPYITGMTYTDEGLWLLTYNDRLLRRLNSQMEVVETISLVEYFPVGVNVMGPTDVSRSFSNGFFIRDHFCENILEINRQGELMNMYSTEGLFDGYNGRGSAIDTNLFTEEILILSDNYIHIFNIGYTDYLFKLKE